MADADLRSPTVILHCRVPREAAEQAVHRLRSAGYAHACVVGEVLPGTSLAKGLSNDGQSALVPGPSGRSIQVICTPENNPRLNGRHETSEHE